MQEAPGVEEAPLARLTVLEVSGTPGPAFATALLADFGARVIVCEPPPGGSALRRLGPEAVQRVWWRIAARNKLSLALDADHPQAAPVLARLAAGARMLVRDGDAPAWRRACAAVAVPPLDLHLFAPGADRPELWPWSTAPELAAAASGAMALTGEAGGSPVQPEMPLAEHATGMLAAASALFELRAAALQGRPAAPLGFGLHEALLRMIEWQLPAAAQGRPELRIGNRFPMNSNIGNVFRTRDGALLTVSAATQAVADRLLRMIGGEALANDPRFRTQADRRANMDALEQELAAWMLRHDAAEALALVRAHDVVAGPIFDAGDLMADPHVRARGDILDVPVPGEGGLPMPGAMPRGLGGAVRHAGPDPGADSDAVLAAAGFAPEEIAGLRRSGVIWT